MPKHHPHQRRTRVIHLGPNTHAADHLLAQSPVLHALTNAQQPQLCSVLDLLLESVGKPWPEVLRTLNSLLASGPSTDHDCLTAEQVAADFINLDPEIIDSVPHWRLPDGKLMKPLPCFINIFVDPQSRLLCRYSPAAE